MILFVCLFVLFLVFVVVVFVVSQHVMQLISSPLCFIVCFLTF